MCITDITRNIIYIRDIIRYATDLIQHVILLKHKTPVAVCKSSKTFSSGTGHTRKHQLQTTSIYFCRSFSRMYSQFLVHFDLLEFYLEVNEPSLRLVVLK